MEIKIKWIPRKQMTHENTYRDDNSIINDNAMSKSKKKLLNYLKIAETSVVLQYVVKSIATCKKNPYIIDQNHIF